MLRNGPISTEWCSDLSYVIGLLATDGNLSQDGRHINLTSKDEGLLKITADILEIRNKIGRKARAYSEEKKYFCLQFGSVRFYRFLLEIGLTPRKSQTLGPLKIPHEYFPDFLRGCIDGDGSITEGIHPESNHPQLRITLCSASEKFLKWIQEQIESEINTTGGWIYKSKVDSTSLLRYGKSDSVKILTQIYKNHYSPCLYRKFAIAQKYLEIP